MPMQVKLLRVLENRSFMRVGGSKTVDVDIRVVAATNRDLKALVEKGLFREDLFYRLDVVDIYLPALKDRREDIPLLAAKFIRELSEKNGRAINGITPAAMKLLEAYDWPGNVRELRNTIEKMVVLAVADTTLDVADVPEELQAPAAASTKLSAAVTLMENEKAQILAVLQECNGNRSEAARRLGIARRTLYRKLDEYKNEGVNVP